MLGSHPSIFYAGEAKKSEFRSDPTKPRRKRVCKLCGETCPVWGTLVVPPGSDLYETLSLCTGCPVVVDSTKGLEWLDARIGELEPKGVRLRLVFLQRDARAVVGSRLRKYPEKSVREHAEEWVAQINATRTLVARFPGEVREVRYERLATQPRAELARLSTWLGVDFDPAMLEPWSRNHHPLGGNVGTQWLVARERGGSASGAVALGDRTRDYYGAHPRGIVLDLRWKQELGPEALAELERIVDPTNRPLAWDEDGSSRERA